jgi:hypothetical protein
MYIHQGNVVKTPAERHAGVTLGDWLTELFPQ